METTMLNLDKFVETSNAVPARTPQKVFMHLVEELGEVSVCINRPHKAEEALDGELCDVINCALDISMQLFGSPVDIPDSETILKVHEGIPPTLEYLFLRLSSRVGALAHELNGSEVTKALIRSIVMLSLGIYCVTYGYNLSKLQYVFNAKCDKWKRVATNESANRNA
jgi:hypothetical protein